MAYLNFGTIGEITGGEYFNLKNFINTVGSQVIISNIVELTKEDYKNFLK